MEPILVPVISYYIGNLTRTTLDVLFWYIYVRKDLLTCSETENKVYNNNINVNNKVIVDIAFVIT